MRITEEWPCDLDLDENYNLVTKRDKNPVLSAEMISGSGRRFLLKYFSTGCSQKEIADYMWNCLYKKYPNIKNMIENGETIITLYFN